MDNFEVILDRIIKRVENSKLTQKEKADIFAQLTVGMHRLVWPILLSHVPEYLLQEAVSQPKQVTLDDYTEIIQTALQNPAAPKSMHDELVLALKEVDELLLQTLH